MLQTNHVLHDRMIRSTGRNSSRSGGFTLIELVIVLFVMFFIIALLMPLGNRLRSDARLQLCLANLNQVGIGTMNYSQDNRGFAPIPPQQDVKGKLTPLAFAGHRIFGGGADWDRDGVGDAHPTMMLSQYWFAIPYLGAELGHVAKIARCPAGGRDGTTNEWTYERGGNPNFSYAYSRFIVNDTPADSNLRLAEAPDKTMLLTETNSLASIFHKEHIDGRHNATSEFAALSDAASLERYGTNQFYSDSKNGDANLIYIDLHAETRNRMELLADASVPDTKVYPFWKPTR